MDVIIRTVRLSDLTEIMTIEQASFTKEEASTKEAMKERIELISDSFFVAEDTNGKVVGFIVGPVIEERYISDDLFKRSVKNRKTGGVQTVLSLAIHPNYRHKKIGQQLINKLTQQCKNKQRKLISLTCLNSLIPFYEKNGFVNEGHSLSTHGGKVWFNLVKNL